MFWKAEALLWWAERRGNLLSVSGYKCQDSNRSGRRADRAIWKASTSPFCLAQDLSIFSVCYGLRAFKTVLTLLATTWTVHAVFLASFFRSGLPLPLPSSSFEGWETDWPKSLKVGFVLARTRIHTLPVFSLVPFNHYAKLNHMHILGS